METCEAFRHRIRREQLVKARLRVATMWLTDAEQVRIWVIGAAHEAELSIRQIAAVGLERRAERRVQTPRRHRVPYVSNAWGQPT